METKKITLSVAIAVFNEAENIESCLSAIKDLADEIVVVDGGSNDDTVAIARKFIGTIVRTDNPQMFHINKQKALEACHGSWILQLDADEIVTDELKKEIILTIHNDSLPINAFYISRRNYFWGHFMKKGGVYPDAVIRLIRNGKARFPCKSVHEQIEVQGEVGKLKEPMLHFSYRTRAEYWKKAETYTSLTAKDISNDKQSTGIKFFINCVKKPIKTFLSIYVRHKGFVDGLTGFEFALYSAMHHQIAFYKSLKFK